jgi:hypothetical protein
MSSRSSRVVAILLCVVSEVPCFAQSSLSEQEQVQAAAIRNELRQFKPEGYTPPRLFCIGAHAHVGDPTALLLTELSDAYQEIVPLSECESRCPEDRVESYPSPVLLRCGRITTGDVWFGPADQANVLVNFIAGPLWGHSGVYKLRRISGKWQVISYGQWTVS